MRFWLALVFFTAGVVASAGAQPVVDSAATLPADSTGRADTVQAGGPLAVVQLSDSAARALDSVAVADLADTTALVLPEARLVGTPVLLYGRRIFDIYSGLGALSAGERARRLGERLGALARNNAFNPDSLRVVNGASLTTLQSGELIVMSVTETDAEAQGMSRNQAALAYAQRLSEEVARVRERSTFQSVLRNAAISIGLLLLLVLLLRWMGRLFRWTDLRFLRLHRRHLPVLTMRGVEIVRSDQIARAGRGVIGLTRLALSLLVVYLFLTTILGLFPWTQAWSRMLLGYLLSPVRAFAAAIVGGLPEFFAIIVVILLIRWAIHGSNWLFRQVETGALSFPGFYPEFAEPTRKIARFLLILLGVFLIYPYTPIADSPVFQGLTIFLGLLFSLGSSTAIANVVAGTLLTYTRAFQIGDRIKVGETVGDVVEKTFLVTRLRTPKNEIVSVPNSATLQAQLVNYSAMAREGPGVIVYTTVTIGYDVPWPTVHRLLEDAARRTAGTEASPPPFVLQTSLGDFSVAYQLNAYTRQASKLPAVLSDMHRHIQDCFAEASIEILSPAYEAQRDGSALTLPKTTVAGDGNGATG